MRYVSEPGLEPAARTKLLTTWDSDISGKRARQAHQYAHHPTVQ